MRSALPTGLRSLRRRTWSASASPSRWFPEKPTPTTTINGAGRISSSAPTGIISKASANWETGPIISAMKRCRRRGPRRTALQRPRRPPLRVPALPNLPHKVHRQDSKAIPPPRVPSPGPRLRAGVLPFPLLRARLRRRMLPAARATLRATLRTMPPLPALQSASRLRSSPSSFLFSPASFGSTIL